MPFSLSGSLQGDRSVLNPLYFAMRQAGIACSPLNALYARIPRLCYLSGNTLSVLAVRRTCGHVLRASAHDHAVMLEKAEPCIGALLPSPAIAGAFIQRGWQSFENAGHQRAGEGLGGHLVQGSSQVKLCLTEIKTRNQSAGNLTP